MTRSAFDFYPTPPAAIKALGSWMQSRVHSLDGVWLDPCVGAGAIPIWLHKYLSEDASWDVSDVQEIMVSRTKAAASHVNEGSVRDGLGPEPWQATGGEPFSAIVMNPPYGKECERWIERALSEAKATVAGSYRPSPYVFALTRVGFWADGSRIRSLAPERLLWLEKRLSFTGDGKTDSGSHCWAVWNMMPRGPHPAGQTVVETIPLPAVSDRDVAIHRAMLGGLDTRQSTLGLDFTGDVVPGDSRCDVGEGVSL